MNNLVKSSVNYMMLSAFIGIILGLVMLFYPGGTMALMQAAFIVLQAILTIFIVFYTLTQANYYFRSEHKIAGVLFILIGLAGTILVWFFDVGVIFYIVAFFLILAGIGDIIGATKLPGAKYFLVVLGIVNIILGIVILRNPIILPLLIAWYVLFWGISRLFLGFELKKFLK